MAPRVAPEHATAPNTHSTTVRALMQAQTWTAARRAATMDSTSAGGKLPGHAMGRRTMRLAVVVAVPVMIAACADGARAPEPGRDARGKNGAVTADHPLAAQAGLWVLQRGGNAMDAGITMAGVLAVARPHMNGVGGDMFLLYYDAKTRQVYGLNASGPAGRRASIARVKA